MQLIRNTNVAIDVVGGALNTFANFKRQHARRLKVAYDEQKAHLRRDPGGGSLMPVPGPIALPFSADLSTVEALYVRYEGIEDAVLRNLSMTGRGERWW